MNPVQMNVKSLKQTLVIACVSVFLASCGDSSKEVAGGTDSLSRTTWSGFHSLLLVDSAGCRPFDAARGGMSFGEGASPFLYKNNIISIYSISFYRKF